MKRWRLAVVATHPVQYQAHWFRALAASPELDLHVFFCHRPQGSDQARAGFGVEFQWDVPLLDGYRSTFLTNVALRPGVDSFRGADTPEIGAALREGKFDALLVCGWFFRSAWQAVWAARRLRIPRMVLSDSTLSDPRSLLRRMLKELAWPLLLKNFDACLAAGTRSREYFEHYGVSASRIFQAPHSVDAARLDAGVRSAMPRRAEIRARWGLQPDSVTALFAGKLIPLKRLTDLLDAVRVAHAGHGNIEVLIAGDGPEREAAERMAAELRISAHFTGFLNQSAMTDAYVASDILVLPSERETWGMVVNEAMACGRPCIVSDRVGCAPDLIMEGETGYVFPVRDTRRLAALLLKMASDPAALAKMGKNARGHMAKFSVEAAVAGTVAAIHASCSQR